MFMALYQFPGQMWKWIDALNILESMGHEQKQQGQQLQLAALHTYMSQYSTMRLLSRGGQEHSASTARRRTTAILWRKKASDCKMVSRFNFRGQDCTCSRAKRQDNRKQVRFVNISSSFIQNLRIFREKKTFLQHWIFILEDIPARRALEAFRICTRNLSATSDFPPQAGPKCYVCQGSWWRADKN